MLLSCVVVEPLPQQSALNDQDTTVRNAVQFDTRMAVSTPWWGWAGWKLLHKIHSFKKQKSNWSKFTAWWIYWNWNYFAFHFHFSISVHEVHESSCVNVEPWILRITSSSVFFILICDDSQILNHQACQPNLVLPLEVPVWLPASIHGALSATSPAGNKTQDRYEAGVFQLKKNRLGD